MKTIWVLIFIGTLMWACTQIESPTTPATESNELKMAEWSELALLMRDIHEDAKDWRASIDSGKLIQDSMAIYDTMVNSTPTDSLVTGPVFEGFSRNYQSSLDSFLLAGNIELAKVKYNNLVTACISCHQEYCPGPIKTIKKLYFPEI